MTWYEILVITGVFGAFGGILDVLRVMNAGEVLQGSAPLPEARRFKVAAALGGFVGCGAAWAMLFATYAAGKLKADDDTSNRLFLVSLSVIAGFLGYRLLQGLASRIEKDVEEVKLRADEVQDKVAQSERRIESLKEYNETLNIGLQAADPLTPAAVVPDAIRKFEGIRPQFPADRALGIVLGRLYHKTGKTEKAVSVLTEVLQAKEAMGTGQDKDTADLSYNRACYHALLSAATADPAAKRSLADLALDDLAVACKLSPPNKIEAVQDADFASLKAEKRFMDAVA